MIEGRSLLATAGAVVAAVVGFNAAAERNAAGEITAAGAVDAFEVRVGDCFDDEAFEADEVSELPGIPCMQPHDNEIYALFDIAGDWPGEERVAELAHEGCYDRFAGAIGRGYEESEIDFATLYPSEGSWNQRHDREVICIGYHVDNEKLSGSVLGSGR